jgi:hypothetical protein
MNPESGRRVFVRNLVVGLPALAGAAALPSPAFAFPRRGVSDRLAPDPGVERTLRELAVLHNKLSGRRFTPAEAGIVAPHLRSLVTYRQQSGRDGELSRAMRGLVAREGRERLILVEPDLTPLRQGLQYYALRAPALPLAIAGPEARGRALDEVVREGAAPFFFDAWAIIDQFRQALLVGDDEWFCAFIEDMSRVLEAMAAVFCLASAFLPVFGPECFAASVILSILKFIEFVGSC